VRGEAYLTLTLTLTSTPSIDSEAYFRAAKEAVMVSEELNTLRETIHQIQAANNLVENLSGSKSFNEAPKPKQLPSPHRLTPPRLGVAKACGGILSFEDIDTNGDGVISREEFKAASMEPRLQTHQRQPHTHSASPPLSPLQVPLQVPKRSSSASPSRGRESKQDEERQRLFDLRTEIEATSSNPSSGSNPNPNTNPNCDLRL